MVQQEKINMKKNPILTFTISWHGTSILDKKFRSSIKISNKTHLTTLVCFNLILNKETSFLFYWLAFCLLLLK